MIQKHGARTEYLVLTLFWPGHQTRLDCTNMPFESEGRRYEAVLNTVHRKKSKKIQKNPRLKK